MAVTITINDDNPQALSLINYLKTLDFVKVKKEMKEPKERTKTDEEKAFKENFALALQEMKDIRSGRKKAKKIETLLR